MSDDDFGVPIPGAVLPPDQWARTAIKHMPAEGPLDWPALYGREAPVVLDLGCGNGRFTIASALRRPGLNHFASDVLPLVLRYATRRGNQRGLHHVRFAARDAQSLLGRLVAPGSVAEVHLYHPQPYPDPREAHLRLVTPRFLADVHRAIEPGGLLVLQTDNPDYWHYMHSVVPAFFVMDERLEPWPDAPEGRTRREILARSRGLRIFRAECRRRDELTDEAIRGLVTQLPLPRFQIRGRTDELDRLERS